MEVLTVCVVCLASCLVSECTPYIPSLFCHLGLAHVLRTTKFPFVCNTCSSCILESHAPFIGLSQILPIKHPGLGVFATSYYAKGDFITSHPSYFYEGRRLDQADVDRMTDEETSYLLKLRYDNVYLDGSWDYAKTGIMSLINNGFNDHRSLFNNNVVFVAPDLIVQDTVPDEFKHKILLRALTDIYPGMELFMDYGWSESKWESISGGKMTLSTWRSNDQHNYVFWRDTKVAWGIRDDTTTDWSFKILSPLANSCSIEECNTFSEEDLA